ncbi:MAG: alpha/beta fold hydrolase [Deltaproteobacteria bacterium]|nr:alpha/beta fold hydrolase [Deltaproteobacteria bacterium]MBN2845726.1 alpha/beta fold hydrolase [Deltaproteobacteria bacterium]
MALEIIEKYPSAKIHETPLLFVHGAWHGAWCWDEYFLDYFASQGFDVYAVSLRGHGRSDIKGSLRFARISDYVEDVATAAASLPKKPVVIGHSMGGLVTQKYLETHEAPAAVLLASVPPRGIIMTFLRIMTGHFGVFLKAILTLSLYPVVATPELVREHFFSPDMSEETLRIYSSQMQDESFLAFLDMLAFSLPKPDSISTPVMVLGAGKDTIFHVKEIESTALAYNTKPHIFPDMAHDMMLETGWLNAAKTIADWLTTNCNL